MKYNKSYEDEPFEKYLQYLDTIKDSLSKELFDFISNPDRHSFSNLSLHDSWVKSIQCENNFDSEKTNITLVLLGNDFIREFELKFNNVTQYTFFQTCVDMYRDLITFEIGLEQDDFENDMLVFRAMFACEKGEIEVFAEDITIHEIV